MRATVLGMAGILVCTALAAEPRVRLRDLVTPVPAPRGSVIVVGFLGAWERWDNEKRSVRKLALRLRERGIPGVFVETAGNHSRKTIRQFLHKALDQNRNGRIDPDERESVGIVLYGQSFGGAACVKLARELQKWQVPVQLTVQIDSVGRNDEVIPANVKRAMNFFQRDPGPIWGESRIRAADPAKTQVLGNQRFTYLFPRPDIDLSDYPRLTRLAPISHWKMDNDPVLFALVEGLVSAEILRWTSARFTKTPASERTGSGVPDSKEP